VPADVCEEEYGSESILGMIDWFFFSDSGNARFKGRLDDFPICRVDEYIMSIEHAHAAETNQKKQKQ
jgi:hypothetical protein